MASRFSPTQQRMMDLLDEGREVCTLELRACLYDELGPVSNIYSHLTFIRKMLEAEGRLLASIRRVGCGHVHYRLESRPACACGGLKATSKA